MRPRQAMTNAWISFRLGVFTFYVRGVSGKVGPELARPPGSSLMICDL